MSVLEEIAGQLNLRWAWEKVKRASVPGDVWFDEVEVASFELNLQKNLDAIRKDMLGCKYRLAPIRPMPFPKPKGVNGKQRIRQYFHISIRDQVAWVAIVNVIGPFIDKEMPAWSYGNRLHRSIWVEEGVDGKKIRKIGRYRHSSGKIYLPFQQSWPIYRRHVFLAARAMSNGFSRNNVSEEDQLEFDLVSSLRRRYQCRYIFENFWKYKASKGKEKLYWCSIDLEKFYPSIRNEIVVENILKLVPAEWGQDIKQLLRKMLSFKIDFVGLSDKDVENLKLDRKISSFHNIPTGLHVSGFLANVALLRVDYRVDNILQRKKSIAHFRFVDDHIIIAYDFDELVGWVDKYLEILDQENTGAKINHEKTEPKELSEYLLERERLDVSDDGLILAKEACELDPDFPSPLMTKTLALVSGLGRANFNLMEQKELKALMSQLEQMLLVELPETEIPERTRLAFAATRLAKLAETKLGSHLGVNEKGVGDNVQMELKNSALYSHEALTLTNYNVQIKEIDYIFSLIKKVLRDRPDRVRLWTRAILLCRQTGLKRLRDIMLEIKSISAVNRLAGEYLVANSLSLIGSNALIASKIVKDENSAIWRRVAAYGFLEDVASLTVSDMMPKKDRHDLKKSWKLFCFGVYCSYLNLSSTESSGFFKEIKFHKDLMSVGKSCLEGEDQVAWAWWASRRYLSNFDSRADLLSIELGERIVSSEDAIEYWKYYPCDIPCELIHKYVQKSSRSKENKRNQGWWFDVFMFNKNLQNDNSKKINNSSAVKANQNIVYFAKIKRYISLVDWVGKISAISEEFPSDPRVSEWTSLEVVRQITGFLSRPVQLDKAYISKSGKNLLDSFVHPGNYQIPSDWFYADNVSWEEWKKITSESSIVVVPNKYKIIDYRYSPLSIDRSTINSVRGLGIILSCLLRRSFELPAIWNGSGQSDVLRLLPKLLLKRITCSSYTLGILQSCLDSRVAENTYRLPENQYRIFVDDDSENDPVSFIQLEHLMDAIKFSQLELERYQLSTLNHQARQLTPINIRLLTDPKWGEVFPEGES